MMFIIPLHCLRYMQEDSISIGTVYRQCASRMQGAWLRNIAMQTPIFDNSNSPNDSNRKIEAISFMVDISNFGS